MNLPVPVVGQEPGPDWANDINACLAAIDQHTHAVGQGIQVTPAGLNINADLAFNSQNATLIRSTRFAPQVSPLALASDVGCLYVSGADLYYNDVAGNQIRITQSGSVTGATGTITGLPSSPPGAGASYSAGTFTFISAAATLATLSVGPISIGSTTASTKQVTVSAGPTQAANYSLVLPLSQGSVGSVPVNDGSGNLSFQPVTPASATSVLTNNGSGTISWQNALVGAVPVGSVIATFPNLTGAYSTTATTVADAYGFVLCQGQTIADSTSPMNGQVIPNLNSAVFIQGNGTSGTTGGASSVTLSPGNINHTHQMGHVHATQYVDQSTPNHQAAYVLTTQQTNKTSVSTSDSLYSVSEFVTTSGTDISLNARLSGSSTDLYTSGVVAGAGGGAGDSAETNDIDGALITPASFSIIPPFISAVYLMRIK